MELQLGQYLDLKTEPWQVSDYAFVDAAIRAQFEAELKALLSMFPEDMQDVDIQLIASYASGNATLGSDIDFIFAPPDDALVPDLQDRWREVQSTRADILQRWHEIAWAYGIRVSLAYGLSAKGTFCYSLGDGLWYGKNEGERLFKRARYNPETNSYTLEAYTPIAGRFRYQPSPDDPPLVV